MESIVPLIATGTFQAVYIATSSTFPGAIYILEMVVDLAILVLFMYVHQHYWADNLITSSFTHFSIVLVLQKKDQTSIRTEPTIIYYLEPIVIRGA